MTAQLPANPEMSIVLSMPGAAWTRQSCCQCHNTPSDCGQRGYLAEVAVQVTPQRDVAIKVWRLYIPVLLIVSGQPCVHKKRARNTLHWQTDSSLTFPGAVHPSRCWNRRTCSLHARFWRTLEIPYVSFGVCSGYFWR
eukprot:2713116-Rhodomonas_salina.6